MSSKMLSTDSPNAAAANNTSAVSNETLTLASTTGSTAASAELEPFYVYGEKFAELTWAWVLGIGCSTAVFLNSILILTLVIKRKMLLVQAPAVYVLCGALANIAYAGPAALVEMADFHLWPRSHFPTYICFIRMMADYVGSYITSFNTALVCWDRFRIVSQGAKYSQEKETRRAWYFVSIEIVGSIILFLVPQLLVPHLTGEWVTTANSTTCKDEQYQYVPQLHVNLSRVISWASMMIPWALYLILSTATCVKLGRLMITAAAKKARNRVGPTSRDRSAAAAVTSIIAPSHIVVNNITMPTPTVHTGAVIPKAKKAKKYQTGNPRKLLRAAAIMFGLVIAMLITYGPYTVVLVMSDFDEDSVDEHNFLNVLFLSYLNPLVDPFVVALTLPRVRKAMMQLLRAGSALLAGRSADAKKLFDHQSIRSTSAVASVVGAGRSTAWTVERTASAGTSRSQQAKKKPTPTIELRPINQLSVTSVQLMSPSRMQRRTASDGEL